MRSSLVVAAVLTLCIVAPAVRGQDHDGWPRPVGEDPVQRRAIVKMVVDSVNQFTFDLYRASAGEGRNVVISPYSAHAALSMTMAGAQGRTADEMYGAMRYPGSRRIPTEDWDLPFLMPAWQHDRAHGPAGALMQSLNKIGDHEQIELAVANSVWPRGSLLPSFTQTIQAHYGASVTSVAYPEPGRTKINAWVGERTNERIDELLKPGDIDGATELVLVNAVYLNAQWARKFDPDKTRGRPFHVTDDKTTLSPFMHMTGELPVERWKNMTAVRLDYAGDRLSALVLVPDAGRSIAEVEEQLTPLLIKQLTERMAEEKVSLALPKFEIRWRTDLVEPLQKLGMKTPFTGKADFSGIDGKGGLYISEVIQEAFIKVHEEGSEAAAATAVIMERKTVQPPLKVTVDRPFLFLIQDRQTGAILFLARVTNPNSKG